MIFFRFIHTGLFLTSEKFGDAGYLKIELYIVVFTA